MMVNKFENDWFDYLISSTDKNRGFQYPNPAVGALLINDADLISEGYHQTAGDAHAEVIALNQAGDQAKDATLLITLEPCVHHGKTPPCIEAIISSGVRRVLWAVNDPNPTVTGKAQAFLESHGIECVPNVRPDEGQGLIKEFYTFHTKKRPFVTLKLALSSDGMIAPNRDGLTYISSEASLQKVQELRRLCQAILVGVDTINIDYPSLSIKQDGYHQPMIVVLDPTGSIDRRWLLEALNNDRKVTIFCNSEVLIDVAHSLFKQYAILGENKAQNWALIIQQLYIHEVHSVLVEGGAKVATSLIQSNYFDEFWLFKTPQHLSNSESVSFDYSDSGYSLDDLVVQYIEMCGDDQLTVYNNPDVI